MWMPILTLITQMHKLFIEYKTEKGKQSLSATIENSYLQDGATLLIVYADKMTVSRSAGTCMRPLKWCAASAVKVSARVARWVSSVW